MPRTRTQRKPVHRGPLPLQPLRRLHRSRRVKRAALEWLAVAAANLLGEIVRAAGDVTQQVGRSTVVPRHVQIALERFLVTVGSTATTT